MDSFWIKQVWLLMKKDGCVWGMTVLMEKLSHLFLASQEQVIGTNAVKARIDKSQEMSGKVDKTFNHVY